MTEMKSNTGKGVTLKKVDTEKDTPTETKMEKFRRLFGFDLMDLTSPSSFVRLLNRPSDPASLGVLRMLFGLLMVIDIPQERGMGNAVNRYTDAEMCHFPLFDNLPFFPLEWLYVLYIIMLIGAVGIMIGYKYRLSCFTFMVIYWYFFFLDKTKWNNHSYLYGLFSLLLLLSDGNRYMSVDAMLDKKIRNAHVPLWNYTLFRTQLFLVYFIAGLKKLDRDWVTGYSMMKLSRKWVFDPFRMILTDEQIDLYIVHLGGLSIDMFTGFLLFFDKTRGLALFFSSSFHIMNSQMFNIGMFPYTMLATSPLFCGLDWPRKVFNKLPKFLKFFTPKEEEIQTSEHCIYSKDQVKPENKQINGSAGTAKTPPPTKAKLYHKLAALFVVLYISEQCFMPYSHGITKGYNNWSQGLYGYSWDMMIRTWSTQHARITYVNRDTGEVGYLDPRAFTKRTRWTGHGDMVVQYAKCIAHHLAHFNMTNIELYFDVWKSMNKRFQQRVFDPRVNILEAEWSPFKEVSFVMPLLVDLSPWRRKMIETENDLRKNYNYTDVAFVADFPGLHLENYVQEDLGNTSITVLSGRVTLELVDRKQNYSLGEGDKMQLPSKEFHKVHTVSETPSCFMYIFVNTTHIKFMENYEKYEKKYDEAKNNTDSEVVLDDIIPADEPKADLYKKVLTNHKIKQKQEDKSFFQIFQEFVNHKYFILARSANFGYGAVKSILLRQSFSDFVNKTLTAEIEQSESEEKMLL